RNAHELGLAAGHLPVQLGVAEQRRARAVLAHLRRLALRLQPPTAHEALTARDVERHHHALTGHEVPHLRPHLLHDTHRLMTEDVATVEERPEQFIEVQVGAADGRGGHPDDRVGRMLDAGIRYGRRLDRAPALPGECLHTVLQSWLLMAAPACGPICSIPPSMTTEVPEMYAASGDARK